MIIFVPGQARSNTCRAGTPTPCCRGPTVFVPLPPLGEHRGGPPEARAGTTSGCRQLCWFPSPSAPFESKSHFHVMVPHKRGMRSSERLRPGTSPVPHCVRRQGHPHPEPWASSSLGVPYFLLPRAPFPLCAVMPREDISQLPHLTPPLPAGSFWQEAVSIHGEHP